ncbi:MAG: Na/Pi cotransporter family protein [Bacteroidales bacterium]|jgi:phosphate:Na+ symporter|nr:Na/Pi cotransporter family protein [Bacteroidales bacterium]
MNNSPSFLMLIFTVLGSLGLLIYGMKSMSEALQKMAGPQLRHILGRMTTNRFTGMLTGVVVTAAVQSSTATTVMTVSFVNASLLTLAQAISVIMGANIGTTLTAWIMSAGFSFNIADVVWPAFLIGMIFIFKKRHATFGDFLFGVAFMFLGLGTLRATGMQMNLGENEAVLNFFASFDPNSIVTTLLFLLIGGILTMCVQSSAAVMAITMILCSSGALPIYQGIALVMGENIGTTVTSNLAALTASTQARRAAFAHMFFNVFGVLWMLIVFHPFIDMVCSFVGYDHTNPEKLSVVLAMFHTCFNITNTLILIGFIPQIEKIVCWAIKDKTVEKAPVRLQYIGNGLVQTPEIAVLQAEKETASFGLQAEEMFKMVRRLLEEKSESKFAKLFAQIENEEEASDQLEIEIAKYLEQVSYDHLSDETKNKIRQMLREVGELESVGDACYNLARTLNRKMESGYDFTEKQYADIREMMQLCEDALKQMNLVMTGRRGEYDINESFRIENEIDAMRQQLKNENIRNINEQKYEYAIGTMFSDIVTDCEKLGDYVINVVEARFGKQK